MYKGDKPLERDLLFNAKSTDLASWFWHSKLTASSWGDIEKTRFTGPGRKSGFTTVWKEKKLFFIAKKEIGETCEGSEGWLQVLEQEDKCSDFSIKEASGIYYSKKETAALWSKGTY